MTPIVWLNAERIPSGTWPFLDVARNSLVELSETVLRDSVDLSEGLESETLTGCLEAYRQVLIRRTIEVAQAVVILWNSGASLGSLICARALLETFSTFHNIKAALDQAADRKDWVEVGRLLDVYSFSTSVGSDRTAGRKGGTPRLGDQVREFIEATQPGASEFWHQISDVVHPNGASMFARYGRLNEGQFYARPLGHDDPTTFQAIYNCLYSLCWFYVAMGEFDELLDRIRFLDTSGEPSA